MGLDLVELVMSVEERFEIDIPDAEAETLCTVGQLIAYVQHRVDAVSSGPPCLSQRAFYRARRALIEAAGVRRADVRPSTSIDALLPRRRRLKTWESVGRLLEPVKVWPELKRPAWLQILLLLAFATTFLASVGIESPTTVSAVALTTLVTTAAVVVGLRVTESLRTTITPDGFTVGDFSRLLTIDEAERLSAEPPPRWTRDVVAAEVRRIVSRELGVTNFSDASSFVYDLGAG